MPIASGLLRVGAAHPETSQPTPLPRCWRTSPLDVTVVPKISPDSRYSEASPGLCQECRVTRCVKHLLNRL